MNETTDPNKGDEAVDPDALLDEVAAAGADATDDEPSWDEALAEAGGDGEADDGEEPDWGDAFAEAGVEAEDESPQAGELHHAGFGELEAEGDAVPEEEVNLDIILDIPVSIALEIGRTQISIRNLLQLNQGSVVELDRFAGEPLDVLVNGMLIAHGEVVVINEKFGIRLTDVISPAERVKKLK